VPATLRPPILQSLRIENGQRAPFHVQATLILPANESGHVDLVVSVGLDTVALPATTTAQWRDFLLDHLAQRFVSVAPGSTLLGD
jgi:hypothetical protein